MSGQIRRQWQWMLVCVDDDALVEPELEIIQGVLPPTDPEESGERGVYAKIGIPGRRLPLTQYVRGEEQTFEFEAFYINDPTVSPVREFIRTEEDGRRVVSEQRRLLKRAAAPHRNLNRPPRYGFLWGETILFICFVESVGSISYSQSLTSFGEPLHMSVSITLGIIDETWDIGPDAPGRPQDKEAQLYEVKDGDTFESIARRQYSDPLLGVAMRQQSKVAFPGPRGRRQTEDRYVKLADSWILKKFGIAPRLLALQFLRGDVSAAFNNLYAARGRVLAPGTVITDPGKQIPFAGLI